MDVPLGTLDLRESEFGWEHVHQKPCFFFLVLTPQRLGFPVFNVSVFLVKPFPMHQIYGGFEEKNMFFFFRISGKYAESWGSILL